MKRIHKFPMYFLYVTFQSPPPQLNTLINFLILENIKFLRSRTKETIASETFSFYFVSINRSRLHLVLFSHGICLKKKKKKERKTVYEKRRSFGK